MKVTFTKNVTIKEGEKLRMFRAGKVYDLNEKLAKRLQGTYLPVKQEVKEEKKIPTTSVTKQGKGRG